MAGYRFVLPYQTVIDGSGVPLPGAKLYFYASGTDTLQNTYSDSGLSTPNTNPVVADADGRFGNIFLSTSPYKVILTDSSDVQQWTADPVNATTSNGFGVQGSIASATTTDLGTVGSQNALVLGTTTITGFGTTATTGLPWLVEFAGSLTLTYDGTKLILPGGANIITQAGDSLITLPLGGGNWRVLAYWRADGTTISQGFGPQASLASGTTTDLGTVSSRNVLITGTASITSLGTTAPAGVPYLCEFNAAATLTYDATNLIIPGSASIVAAQGDSMIALPLGGGRWRVLAYWKFSGLPITVTQVLDRAWMETANGSYTITLPATVTATTRVHIKVCGPGGGGGGAATGNGGGGGGGGAGGYYEAILYGFTGGTNITGNVGGTAGTGGTNADGNPGNAATTLVYNGHTVVSANFGAGGINGTAAGGNAGGAGGSVTLDLTGLTVEATLFNLSTGGDPGYYSSSDVNSSGGGGWTPAGKGGSLKVFGSGGTGVVGNNGAGYGSGGGGAVGANSVAGGDGKPGFVFVELLA